MVDLETINAYMARVTETETVVHKPVSDKLKVGVDLGTDDFASIELVYEQLSHTLVHELVDAFLKLFWLHRVIILYIFEKLGRERGESSEMDTLTFSQRIAYLEYPIVW